MNIRHVAAIIVFVAALAVPSISGAQDRWSAEVLPGVAIPTEKLGDADVNRGVGADATIGYRVMHHLSVYGGWGWRHFPTDVTFMGKDVEIEETGYAFGARFEHPLGSAGLSELVIRLGGTYDHVEVEDSDGNIVDDSGHGLGFEVGTGIAFRLGDKWRVTPGARFRSTSREFTDGAVVPQAKLRYVALEIGFSRRF